MAKKSMFDANNSTLSVMEELVEGQIPTEGDALVTEPNSIDAFGNSIESTTRNPLSTSRDAKKGTVTSLSSTVEISQDLTISAYKEFMSGALSANWVGTNNLTLTGGSIYDVVQQDDHWEFKVKKPLYNLPTTAKLITSGFLNEKRNGELEIEEVDRGMIIVKNAEEHGFSANLLSLTDMFDPNGRITVEWEDIVPESIYGMNSRNYVKLPAGIRETLEIGAKVVLDGFANPNINREYVLTGLGEWENTVTLYPEPEAESSDAQITIPGNTFDIYAGALTGDSAETVDVTISASGTYKITIGSITSTVSGSQTIQIQANGTDIVNEAREFSSAGATITDLTFTHTKVEGQEQITTIKLVGANLSATDVVITYKEDDTKKPADRKMYVSMECRNWTSFLGLLIPYPYIFGGEGVITKFSGYNNSSNNGIFTVLSSDAGNDYFSFSSKTPVVAETVDYSTTNAREMKTIGIEIAEKTNKSNIDEAGNLVSKSSLEIMQAFGVMLKGSAIWIGGTTPDTQFEDEYANGLARINNIDINAGIFYLDKRANILNEDGTKHIFVPDTEEQLATKRIPIYFGEFLRTYDVGDVNYKRKSYTYELKTTNDAGVSYFEYSKGNLINTLTIGLPSQEKATLDVANISMQAMDATTTPMSWKRIEPEHNKVMSTPSDVLVCRVSKLDESGLATLWTDASIEINNNVNQEYAIGSLAPVAVAQGQFDVVLSGSVFYQNPEVASAITNNCTISADVFLTNEDGGIFIDIPTATMSDGSRDFTNNEKIKQALTVTAYKEIEWGYSISTTCFPYLPLEKTDACK